MPYYNNSKKFCLYMKLIVYIVITPIGSLKLVIRG